MNMISMVGTRQCDVLVDALKAELGGILAGRILEAEALDFLWDGRVKERYLGQCAADSFEDEEGAGEFSRVAILSLVDGNWHVAMCLVDGDGAAIELVWKRRLSSFEEAETGLLQAR